MNEKKYSVPMKYDLVSLEEAFMDPIDINIHEKIIGMISEINRFLEKIIKYSLEFYNLKPEEVEANYSESSFYADMKKQDFIKEYNIYRKETPHEYPFIPLLTIVEREETSMEKSPIFSTLTKVGYFIYPEEVEQYVKKRLDEDEEVIKK